MTSAGPSGFLPALWPERPHQPVSAVLFLLSTFKMSLLILLMACRASSRCFPTPKRTTRRWLHSWLLDSSWEGGQEGKSRSGCCPWGDSPFPFGGEAPPTHQAPSLPARPANCSSSPMPAARLATSHLGNGEMCAVLDVPRLVVEGGQCPICPPVLLRVQFLRGGAGFGLTVHGRREHLAGGRKKTGEEWTLSPKAAPQQAGQEHPPPRASASLCMASALLGAPAGPRQRRLSPLFSQARPWRASGERWLSWAGGNPVCQGGKEGTKAASATSTVGCPETSQDARPGPTEKSVFSMSSKMALELWSISM